MRRIVLALLMLAVMLPSAAFARSAYFCTKDGTVRPSCCCPTKTSKQKRQIDVVTLGRASCCEVSVVAPVTKPAVDLTPKAGDGPPDVVVASTPAVHAVHDRFVARVVHRANAPPPSQASLFARHCALLL